MLQALGEHSTVVGARGVVLSPTRELAAQTHRFAKQIGRFTSLRFALLVGGDSLEGQFEALAANPDIIIATPGRLMHLLAEVRELSLARVSHLVFDEADRLFEMGFADQLHATLKAVPDERQTLLFSATLPAAVVQFARAGLTDPEIVRLDTDTKISDALCLGFLQLRPADKTAALLYLLREVIPDTSQVLVFAATRHAVDYIVDVLTAAQAATVAAVYGVMDPLARRTHLSRFRAGASVCRVLVVTDVAARGLDIPLLDAVINFDFPDTAKTFVHRCGRVARAGRRGVALSLVTRTDAGYMMDVHSYLGRPASTGATGDVPVAVHRPGEAPPAGQPLGPPADLVQDASYTLQDMTAASVHYGTIPRSLIAADVEISTRLVGGDPELAQRAKSMLNAADKFLRMRAEASRRAVTAGKHLSWNVAHPLLAGRVGDGGRDRAAFVTSLSAFRPAATIMEVDGSRSKRDAAATLMARKRAERKAGSIMAADVGLSLTGELPTPEAEAEAPTAQAPPPTIKHKAYDPKARAAAKKAKAKARAARKRVLAQGGTHAEAAAAAAAVAGSTQTGTPRPPPSLASFAVPGVSVSGLDDDEGGDVELAGAGGGQGGAPPPSRGTKRPRTTAADFRDAKHFISALPEAGVDAAEQHLALYAGERGGPDGTGELGLSRAEEAIIATAGDEELTRAAKARRVAFWDPRKKRYVKISAEEAGVRAGRLAKGRVERNEAGVVVRRDGKSHGELYAKWTARTKRSVGAAGDAEGGGGGGDATGPAIDWRKGSRDPRQRKAALAVAAQRREESGEGDSGPGAQRPGKGGRGGGVPSELRSAADMAKARGSRTLHKLENVAGGLKKTGDLVRKLKADAKAKRAKLARGSGARRGRSRPGTFAPGKPGETGAPRVVTVRARGGKAPRGRRGRR